MRLEAWKAPVVDLGIGATEWILSTSGEVNGAAMMEYPSSGRGWKGGLQSRSHVLRRQVLFAAGHETGHGER